MPGDVQGHQDFCEGETVVTFKMLNSLSKMYLLINHYFTFFFPENLFFFFFLNAYVGKFGGV